MKAIKIAICEDNKSIQEELFNYVASYFKKKNKVVDIQVFSSGLEFKESLSKNNYTLVLMDIDLGDANGISLIEELRRTTHFPVEVVFITSYKEYKLSVLPLHTFDYIEKPFTKEKIETMLDDVCKWIVKKEEKAAKVSFKTTDGLVALKVDDILYFEYANRRVEIYTFDNQYIMYSSIKEAYKKLEEYNFISPHAAFLINLNHVELLTKNRLIVMNNGAKIPIAQNRLKSIRDIYFEFISS